jgi:cell division GTPase FtsZ
MQNRKNTLIISKRTTKLEVSGRKKNNFRGTLMSNENVLDDFIEPENDKKSVEEALDDIPDFDDLPDMTEAAESAEKFGIIEDEKTGKTSVRMAFVGSGQAGGNLVDQYFLLGYRRVLAINTASQDMKSLKMNKANQYVLEGYDGAGKNPKVGQEAITKHYENVLRKFHQCFGKNVEHIMICVGAAGGTGCGSAETLVSIAKDFFKEIDKPAKVGLIVAMPEKTEKGAMKQNAQTLVKKLLQKTNDKAISPLIIVDNEQIAKFFPNESISNFYPKSNQIVCGIFDRFNTITAYASPIGHNVDGADYKELLNGGLMTYGQCKIKDIKDDTTLSEAIVKNVKSTLLATNFELSSATNACCLIVSSEDQLLKITKDAVNKAIESLSRVFTNKEVKIHLGIYKANAKGVSICTAISGLGVNNAK